MRQRARLKVLSISEESLGTDGSMSEVRIPPANNSEKTHIPVAVNNQHNHSCNEISFE